MVQLDCIFFFQICAQLSCSDAIGLVVGGEREIQKSYWVEHSADLTVEAMMLDSKAVNLDKEERPEVISLSSGCDALDFFFMCLCFSFN